MKKFLAMLLSFVMLFSLTMPAMAADVNGDTEGDVSGTFNPEIMFTSVEISSSFVTRYDDSTGTYIAVIQPRKTSTEITATYVGKNLEYLKADNTLLKTRSDSSIFGECDDPLVAMIENNFKSIVSYGDGSWVEFEYSNDGGQTWDGVRVEVKQGYAITNNTAADANGSVSVPEYAVAGETVTLNVSPVDGYMLDTVTVTDGSGNNVTVENNQFTMPASAVTVNATFKTNPKYNITINASENGSVSADMETATAGTTVTLTVNPDDGYELDTLKINDGAVTAVKGEDGKYTFAMPAGDAAVTATFLPHTHTYGYALSTTTTENDTIIATCTAQDCDNSDCGSVQILAPANTAYTGNAVEADVKNSLTTGDSVAVVYAPAENLTDGKPVNVGSYTASITFGGKTISAAYSITKATPVISANPTASAITYGQSLKNSSFTGGTVSTTGDFDWVSPDTNPSVADSGKTMYEVVFTPSDSANWNTATTSVTITVNKALNAPNMPSTEMKPAKSKEKIGDVGLPTGWEWSAESKVTLLETGEAVTGSAIYVGADKGNYVNESVEITLTRSNCDHLYESTVTKEPTTTEEGVRTYTCKYCADSYTEVIPKKENSGGSSSSGTGGGTVLPPTEPDTKPDDTKEETITETETGTNSSGKEVVVTTTTKTDADGNVLSVTEKTVIAESSGTTSTTVTVKKDGEGEIVSAKATIVKTVSTGSKATIQSSILAQIIEAAGTEDVTVSMTVKDAEGKTKYTVKADAGDFEPGNELYIYKYDTRAKEYTLVNAKTYTVNKAGNVAVSMKTKATYYLVDSEEAAEINKKIVSTIKPKKVAATVKKGKSVVFTLSDKVNPDNIKSITYTTSKKSVATVGKKGKISAKKKGTVTVKAKVTLKNGMTKTIKMTIKVK